MKILLVSACIAATFCIPSIAWAQDEYPYSQPAQYEYAPPVEYQYSYPPAQYDYYGEPIAPPGAAWVGPPGECLYSYATREVYWCAPGVVFTGFPVGWDYDRYPIVNIAPGIVLDPDWYGGWRRDHPLFEFRGRFARDEERREFFEHREEFRNRGRGPERGRPQERRDERRGR